MKLFIKKKLWNKRIISLRDYEAHAAIEAGGCIIEYKGKRKTFTTDELREKLFSCHKTYFPSKKPYWKNPLTGMNGYSLIDLDWKK